MSEKPKHIIDSMRSGNTRHLSNAGRRGAKVTNEIKEFKRAFKLEEAKQEIIDKNYAVILHEHGEEAAEEWLKEAKPE